MLLLLLFFHQSSLFSFRWWEAVMSQMLYLGQWDQHSPWNYLPPTVLLEEAAPSLMLFFFFEVLPQ